MSGELNRRWKGQCEYRPGEREAIEAWLQSNKATICPGFGEGPLPHNSDPVGFHVKKRHIKQGGKKSSEAQTQKARERWTAIFAALAANPCRATLERLAKEYKLAEYTIQYRAREHGIRLPHRQNERREPDAFDRKVSELYQEGWSMQQLASGFKVSESRIKFSLVRTDAVMREANDRSKHYKQVFRPCEADLRLTKK